MELDCGDVVGCVVVLDDNCVVDCVVELACEVGLDWKLELDWEVALGCTWLVVCCVVLNVGCPPLFSWIVKLLDCTLLSAIVLSEAVTGSLVSCKLDNDKLVVEISVDISLEVVELCTVVDGIDVVLEKI